MQNSSQDIHIFTDNLNNIYLINNHIQQSSSQYLHLDKLLISSIVYYILWNQHKITIQKIKALTRIKGNGLANTLATDGTTKATVSPKILNIIDSESCTPKYFNTRENELPN